MLSVLTAVPWTAEAETVIIDFDQIMTNAQGSGIWAIIGPLDVLPEDFTLDPTICDINSGFDISEMPTELFPNEILDSDEFALVAETLADPTFDRSANGGTSHQEIYNAWTHNLEQTIYDLGGDYSGYHALLPPTSMVPDVEYLMAVMFTIGDMDSQVFPIIVLDLVVNDPTASMIIGDPHIRVPEPKNYDLMHKYLAWCGDADGDGCSNLHEYEYAQDPDHATHRANYLAAALDPAIPSGWTTSDPICDGTGGLFGEYFNNTNLTGLNFTRQDQQVAFDWGRGSPDSEMADNLFSVRWTGWVEPEFSERYTFTTRTDDGIRLWLDGVLLIDDWTNHSAQDRTGTTAEALVAGQQYPIKMEFYENSGVAVAWLGWETADSANQPKKAIYEMFLTPGTGEGPADAYPQGTWLRNPANGHFYRLIDAMTWPEARQEAEDTWGGYLVTIDDAEENAWVNHYFSPFGIVFIGANDTTEEGRWVWAENDQHFWQGDQGGELIPGKYASWNASEPNDSGGAEDCAEMYTDGYWNDISISHVTRAVVEADSRPLEYSGPSPSYTWLEEGETFYASVEAIDPYGQVTYQWRHDGDNIDGETDATLILQDVHVEDQGWYTCVIVDESPAIAETTAAYLKVSAAGSMPASGLLGLGVLAGLCALAVARRLRPSI